MKWTPVLLATACTLNGKPIGSLLGGSNPTAAVGDSTATSEPAVAATAAKVAATAKTVARCPNGKRYFLGAAEVFPGHGVMSVAIADMNGDGKADIVTGNPHGKRPAMPHLSNVGVMLNNGDGTFKNMVLTPIGGDSTTGLMTGANVMSLGDLDGDKRPDIVFSAPGWGGSSPVYAINSGDGAFAENVSLHASSTAGVPIIADLNGDGRKDVVVGSFVWLNTGSKHEAKLTSKVRFNEAYDGAETAGDFDGDGAPDLVVLEDGVTLYLNDGNASFSKGKSLGIDSPQAPRTGDFNGDGKPDLAMLAKGSVAVVLGTGGGQFAAPQYYRYPESFSPGGVLVADLNSDGKDDVVLPDPYKGIAVYMNDGKGRLAEPISLAADKAWMAAAGDLTGTGVKSVVVVDDSESSDEDKSHIYVMRASCR